MTDWWHLLLVGECLLCHSAGEQLCPSCRKVFLEVVTEVIDLEGLKVLGGYRYNKALRFLLSLAKHHGYYRGADYLGKLLFQRFESQPQSLSLDLLLESTWVPVPISAAKLEERGFNQVERIFSGFSQGFLEYLPSLKYADLLLRRQETVTQIGQNTQSRAENLRGVFGVRGNILIPQSVVLLDDVCTTGSTLIECAKVLRQRGVDRVSAVCLFVA